MIDLLKESASREKPAEGTGSDAAAFCGDLIKDVNTYADIYQESGD